MILKNSTLQPSNPSGSPPVAEAYTRFQDITWQLIPEGSEWANVMGFNVMCRPSKKIRDGLGEWEETRDFFFSCGSDGGRTACCS